MQRVGDWETIVKPDLINIVNHYRNEGVTEFAIFGFCWGGKVSTLASIELSKEFKASALIHPSSVTTEEAFNVTIPMYLMPTQSENDMVCWSSNHAVEYSDIVFILSCHSTRYSNLSLQTIVDTDDSTIWYMVSLALVETSAILSFRKE